MQGAGDVGPNPEVEAFFDPRTKTLTYVAYHPPTRDAVIVDPVLDYDPAGSKTSSDCVDRVLAFVSEGDLTVHAVLETHAHADHLSGAQWIKTRHPDAALVIGSRMTEVQALFKRIFDLPADFPTDGSQFDRLVGDGEVVEAGRLRVETIHTPGHTPACVTYRIGNAIFTGDALFMPDQGTGRCDFPGGSAEALYRSVHDRLYELPDETRVFVGHDYQTGGRELRYESTIGAERRENVQLQGDTSMEAFVEMRAKRDATLSAPQLLFQSVQVNIDAGRLPDPSRTGVRYLRIPVNVFRPHDDAGDIVSEKV